MTEYITKLQALQAFEKAESINTGFSRLNLFGLFSLELASIPTADVAPVAHGYWIESDHGSYLCSVCGEDWTLNYGTPDENNMNYCPQCGAIMDLQQPMLEENK